MQVALYIRVSSADQVEHGSSLDNQLDKMNAYCLYKGWSVKVTYKDEGISGFKGEGKRSGFALLMDSVRKKEVEAVVVYSLSRFARNTMVTLESVLAMKEAGVVFVSLTENIDTSTPMGMFMLTVMAAMAQLERDQISQRTKDVLQYKKKQGERVGTIPYGWQVVFCPDPNCCPQDPKPEDRPKHLICSVTESQVMWDMWMLRSDGQTFEDVAVGLNKRGHRNRKGEPWTAKSVQKIYNKYIKNRYGTGFAITGVHS